MHLDRRKFLSLGLAGALAPFSSINKNIFAHSLAKSDLRNITDRILVSLMLVGGPDFRHLFVPQVSTDINSYGYAYWNNRYTAHGVTAEPSTWQNRYDNNYTTLTSSGTTFGMLSSCRWLIDQFNQGNVAIVNNVIGSTSRDHSFSQLVMESGNSSSSPTQLSQSGWGGRLAQYTSGRLISAARRVRLFCNGDDPIKTYDNSHVISFNNSREFGLYHNEALTENPGATDARSIMSRALKSYYAAKQSNISSPFDKFTTTESNLRSFGANIKSRLDATAIPDNIMALYSGSSTLNSTYLGRQIRNLYDAYLCFDLLNFKVASLELGGFDSHKNLLEDLENNFKDMFSSSGAFSSLFTSLNANITSSLENTVLVIGGEFGRQLASNGDAGSDHGRGNSILVIGNNVNGGIYGKMFPTSELVAEEGFNRRGSDITGLTSMESVFGRVCDWASNVSAGGTANNIIDRSNIIEESSGIMDGLFS